MAESHTSLPLCRLSTQWQMGGSDLPDLELENWIEPSRPRNEEEKLTEFILEAKIFKYHPHAGTLQPGESCTVRLAPSLGSATTGTQTNLAHHCPRSLT